MDASLSAAIERFLKAQRYRLSPRLAQRYDIVMRWFQTFCEHDQKIQYMAKSRAIGVLDGHSACIDRHHFHASSIPVLVERFIEVVEADSKVVRMMERFLKWYDGNSTLRELLLSESEEGEDELGDSEEETWCMTRDDIRWLIWEVMQISHGQKWRQAQQPSLPHMPVDGVGYSSMTEMPMTPMSTRLGPMNNPQEERFSDARCLPPRGTYFASPSSVSLFDQEALQRINTPPPTSSYSDLRSSSPASARSFRYPSSHRFNTPPHCSPILDSHKEVGSHEFQRSERTRTSPLHMQAPSPPSESHPPSRSTQHCNAGSDWLTTLVRSQPTASVSTGQVGLVGPEQPKSLPTDSTEDKTILNLYINSNMVDESL